MKVPAFPEIPVALLALAVLFSLSGAAVGETVEVGGRNALVKALSSAKPGTRIAVAPGNYAGGISIREIAGRMDAPIVVAAKDRAKPPIFQGGTSGLHLSGCAYVELDGLVFEGAEANGLNIDDAGRAEEPARGIVLRGLTIRNSSPRGNRDGIKLSGVADFLVTDCVIEDWGTSGSGIDMVGCHQGVIEETTLRRTGAEAARNHEANGIQMKGGSSGITVRKCNLLHTGGRGVNLGGSTGADYFRPPGAGAEARDLTLEDCVIEGSMAPVAFVGVDGATVRRNRLRYPGRWAFRILQENSGESLAPCRNGVITENRIVFRSSEMAMAVNVGGGTAPETFRFERNTWLCEDRPAETRRRVRLPVEEIDGNYGTAP